MINYHYDKFIIQEHMIKITISIDFLDVPNFIHEQMFCCRLILKYIIMTLNIRQFESIRSETKIYDLKA